jgi:hypothetical protein
VTRRSIRLAPGTQFSFRDIEIDGDDEEDEDDQEDDEDEEERDTTLQTLVKLVGDLKETMEHQGTIIKNTQTELVAIREEQQGLRTQNAALQEEIRTLRGLCEGMPSPPKNTGNVLRDAHQTKVMDPHDRKGQGSELERLPGPSQFPDGVAVDTIPAAKKRLCQYSTSQIWG